MLQYEQACNAMVPQVYDLVGTFAIFITLFTREMKALLSSRITIYSKTCLKRPLKIDKTKILMTNGSLMNSEGQSIAECSPWTILHYFHLH